MNEELREKIIDFLKSYHINQMIMRDNILFAKALGFNVYTTKELNNNAKYFCAVFDDKQYKDELPKTLDERKAIVLSTALVPPAESKSIVCHEIAYYIYVRLFKCDKPQYVNKYLKYPEGIPSFLEFKEILENIKVCGYN